jgi:hypothetical protein
MRGLAGELDRRLVMANLFEAGVLFIFNCFPIFPFVYISIIGGYFLVFWRERRILIVEM